MGPKLKKFELKWTLSLRVWDLCNASKRVEEHENWFNVFIIRSRTLNYTQIHTLIQLHNEMLNTRAGWPRIFSLRYNLLLFGLMLLALVWLHLTSSSSSFNIQNDVGLHRHRHKSIISHHCKVWWCQAVTSIWCVWESSCHDFYPSHQWRLPLTHLI